MRIRIVSPVPQASNRGNGVTARRWQEMLTDLGHRVELVTADTDPRGSTAGEEPDLLLALHAGHGHDAVRTFRQRHPGRRILVAMTGTDLYQALPDSVEARRSLELADLVIILHPAAFADLPEEFRGRARLVIQSAVPPAQRPTRSEEHFEVCVLAHLRRIKQPLLAARAARLLPAESRIRVTLAGGVLEPALEAEVEAEQRQNPRFRWLGEVSGPDALALVAGSHLLAMTSELEGGGNVISEALACDVPVLASRIPAANGMLGHDYPGLFPVGDRDALAALLARAETDASFRAELRARCAESAPLVDPRRERSALACLVTELDSSPDHREPLIIENP